MMNIGNLSSKQSVGFKFKEGSSLKATGIFVILISLDVFESNSPEKSPNQSLPKVSLEADEAYADVL